MIIYVLIAAFVGGLAVGGGGVWKWKAAQEAEHELAQAQAQAKIEAQAKEIADEAAAKQIGIANAFAEGEKNAKVIEKKVYIRSGQLATSTLAFANPVCFIGADGLQLANSTRAGIEPAATSAGANSALPGTGTGATGSGGRGTVVPGGVSGVATGQPASGNVPAATGSASGGAGVPAASPRGVATNPLKPK